MTAAVAAVIGAEGPRVQSLSMMQVVSTKPELIGQPDLHVVLSAAVAVNGFVGPLRAFCLVDSARASDGASTRKIGAVELVPHPATSSAAPPSIISRLNIMQVSGKNVRVNHRSVDKSQPCGRRRLREEFTLSIGTDCGIVVAIVQPTVGQ